MRLWLPSSAIASSDIVADLVRKEATQQPHERRGYDDGYDGQTQQPEFPARGDENCRSRLSGCTLDGDEDRVDCDDPENIRKEHRPRSIQHALSGLLVLKAVRKDAQIRPQRPGGHPVVNLRPRLSRPQQIHFLPAQLLLAAHPAGLRHEEENTEPSGDREGRRNEIDVPPADGYNDDGARNAEGHDDEPLRAPDGTHGRVALVDEHDVLDDERDERFDGARTDTLKAARGDVGFEAFAEARPQAAAPGQDAAHEKDGTAADADGERHQEVAADAVGEERQRGQQGDFPEGWATEAGEDLERVEIDDAGRVERAELDFAEDFGVDARVLESEDGNERRDDGFGRESEGAD